jgi:hypothetical protein
LPRESGDFLSARVAIQGDAHPFDNLCSVSWPERQQLQVVYLGPDDELDRLGLRFFLRPLFADTDARIVAIGDQLPSAGPESPAGSEPIALVIATGAVDRVAERRDWISRGGTMLYVCDAAGTGESLFALAGVAPQPIAEAVVSDYAMLREVDFKHPLFRAMNDPRYSDLSKVHFWKHRRLDPAALPGSSVLARLDSGDPLLLEMPVNQGRLLVLASGWNRADSDLAMWSKFIPLMNALLETAAPQNGGAAQSTVGEALPLPMFADRRPPPVAVQSPDGTTRDWSAAVADPVAAVPGLYRVLGPDAQGEPLATIAVNIPAGESQTSPLDADVFDAVGLRLAGESALAQADAPREEQLARGELESRQKLWRFLLLAALLVLLAESCLAGRRTGIDLPAGTEAP